MTGDYINILTEYLTERLHSQYFKIIRDILIGVCNYKDLIVNFIKIQGPYNNFFINKIFTYFLFSYLNEIKIKIKKVKTIFLLESEKYEKKKNIVYEIIILSFYYYKFNF